MGTRPARREVDECDGEVFLLDECIKRGGELCLVVADADSVGFAFRDNFPRATLLVACDDLVRKALREDSRAPHLKRRARRAAFQFPNYRIRRDYRDETIAAFARFAQKEPVPLMESVKGAEDQNFLLCRHFVIDSATIAPRRC